MSDTAVAYFVSPIGLVRVEGGPAGLTRVDFVEARAVPGSKAPLPRPVAEALRQLEGYFRGTRKDFTVALDLRGTPFQKKVWDRLRKVGFGRTTTYKALAKAAGRPAATRAVGGANHRNPVSIIVPCHRVLGSDGRLTGYGGGLWRKDWLLRHEGHDRIKI